jgi:hypothetical protein
MTINMRYVNFTDRYVDVGDYQTIFSLDGVPRVNKFVGRQAEITEIEQVLLPQSQNQRQNIFVLFGLGGIGKTQLSVEFARRHHSSFSSVFWLDGSSEDSLKQSIAKYASKIPKGQISDESRGYAVGKDGELDTVVAEVLRWLALPENTEWLLIFDNVDRDYGEHNSDPQAYDVTRYLSGADHGSILITTRLAKLEQLGASQRLNKVDPNQARLLFENSYRKEYGKVFLELRNCRSG